MEVMRPLGMALFQLTHSGTEAQRREALEVLNETRRKLYRILADEDPAEDASVPDAAASLPSDAAAASPTGGARRSPRPAPPSPYGGGTASSSEAGPPLVWMTIATITTAPPTSVAVSGCSS